MSFKRIFPVIAAMALPMTAFAQLAPAQPPTCSVTDLTIAATACSGAWANNNLQAGLQADVAAEIASLSGTTLGTLGLLGSSNEAVSFGPFSANPITPTGTLTFDGLLSGPFVLAIKAANSFSLYYFDGSAGGITSLAYSTIGTAVNGNGIAQGLSHASLYAAPGSITVVPEPASYLLMAAGVAGLLAARRRRG